MDETLQKLIKNVKENSSDPGPKLVLADFLTEKLGDPRGEYLALDVALRNGLDNAKARQTLREGREKVWQDHILKEMPEYFLQDKFWMGSFPLRFPNTGRLGELDGTFAEDFPNYQLLPQANTFAQGVHALRRACGRNKNSTQPTGTRKDGTKIYRPFTFRENILARVEDYWTFCDIYGNRRSDDDRLRLFNTWLDSCTGIAYKRDSPKFKLISASQELILLPENFNAAYLPIEYDSVDGIELDWNRGTYGPLLSQLQVLENPAWNAAMEEDKPLLKEYTNIVFSQRQGNNMSLWLRDNIEEDQLRVLFLNNLSNYSSVDGYNSPNYGGLFLAR